VSQTIRVTSKTGVESEIPLSDAQWAALPPDRRQSLRFERRGTLWACPDGFVWTVEGFGIFRDAPERWREFWGEHLPESEGFELCPLSSPGLHHAYSTWLARRRPTSTRNGRGRPPTSALSDQLSEALLWVEIYRRDRRTQRHALERPRANASLEDACLRVCGSLPQLWGASPEALKRAYARAVQRGFWHSWPTL
jgi:hypothetical protein